MYISMHHRQRGELIPSIRKRQPAKVKHVTDATTTYVIPGFAENWRKHFTPERFRAMKIDTDDVDDDPNTMRRIMHASEAMLEALPQRLAELMKLKRPDQSILSLIHI